MKKKKKICFLINNLAMGGAEIALVNLVNVLNPERFDITVLVHADNDNNTIKNRLNKNITFRKIYKRSINKTFLDKVRYKAFCYMTIALPAKVLYKLFVKKDYDIEVAFLEGQSTKILSGSTSSAKKIAWVHTDLLNYRESDLFFYKNNTLERNAYRKFNEICCVSEQAKRSIEKRFGVFDDIKIVGNVIDHNSIIRLAKERPSDFMIDKNAFNILSVGRLHKVKGYTRLVSAFHKFLEETGKKAHLYIVGEGEEREKIERAITKFNLESNVTLLGRKENPHQYVKRADLYVCSSFAEGYPLTIREALILGVPVLTTDFGRTAHDAIGSGKYGEVVENSEKGLLLGLKKMSNQTTIKKLRDNVKKYQAVDSELVNYIKNDILLK